MKLKYTDTSEVFRVTQQAKLPRKRDKMGDSNIHQFTIVITKTLL